MSDSIANEEWAKRAQRKKKQNETRQMQRDKETGDDEQISVGCKEVQLKFRMRRCTSTIVVCIRVLEFFLGYVRVFVCIIGDESRSRQVFHICSKFFLYILYMLLLLLSLFTRHEAQEKFVENSFRCIIGYFVTVW